MGNYQQPPLVQNYPPMPNSAQSSFETQRPVEYGTEGMNNAPPYTYPIAMDSFVENAIDEMSHNPLAYIGGE
jgi:hypothetical protein